MHFPTVFLSILLPYFVVCVHKAQVDPAVISAITAHKRPTVIIEFRDNQLDYVREKFRNLKLYSRAAKAQKLYEMMKENADLRQGRVLSMLGERKLADPNCTYHQLWITNSIICHDMNLETLNELVQQYPEIRTIAADRAIPHPHPATTKEDGMIMSPNAELENWAFHKIHTLAALRHGCTGRGVVVANIDTGVLWNHMALKKKYRGAAHHHDYHWFDPLGISDIPSDVDGHGTHTMGTICADPPIGHAPQAQWIACRGCNLENCPMSALLACGQWMACPTDLRGEFHDCSKAPDIVCNSWGLNEFDEPFFNELVITWNHLGIASFFVTGNDGSLDKCGTCESPGAQPEVFAVGATYKNDSLAFFSGTGPGVNGVTKPEVTAPGVGILSAVSNCTTCYEQFSGTSMAAPCVAAMGALVLSVRPNLEPFKVYEIIKGGCDPPESFKKCTPNDTFKLNNQYGHGRVVASKICARALSYESEEQYIYGMN